MQTFENLQKKIANSDDIRLMCYINLLKRITNEESMFPNSIKIRKVLGEELFLKLESITQSVEYPCNKLCKDIYFCSESEKTNPTFLERMEKYLEDKKIAREKYEIAIKIVQNWIDDQPVKKIDSKLIEKFESKIAEHHDWSLTKIDGKHCTRLFNDGEINETKSGHCYGARSTFSVALPFSKCFPVTFPVGHGKWSYAVLPSSLAISLRSEMMEIMK